MSLLRGRDWWRLRSPSTALVVFGLWLGLLLASLALEHRRSVSTLLDSDIGGAVYLGVALVLYLSALLTCIGTLLRGSRRTRRALIVPMLLLIAYGLVLLGGPG